MSPLVLLLLLLRLEFQDLLKLKQYLERLQSGAAFCLIDFDVIGDDSAAHVHHGSISESGEVVC